MKGKCLLTMLILLQLAGCDGAFDTVQPPPPTPVQVVYRFDDHRYLELKGWDCEGALTYVDTRRNIRSEVSSQFYRIFTARYVHPSERYIAVLGWRAGGFTVSKDYGQTWHTVMFAPTTSEDDGTSSPRREDIVSFTVVNDQGFLLTKQGRIYMSSKPFDDPRLAPGGPGITYELDGEKQEITPQFPGWAWGMVYFNPKTLITSVEKHKINWQNLPEKIPEVKNYTGWDHMRCDMDAGRK
ncbi:T6SS immunity protein Tli3 family protein [Franconibacter daqui]|uniref:Tli3-like domain-containing protein n=1 Tax=Franconibacter daqui TaxID=2047724 RepID=A0ABV1PQ81_9ENTR